jgi:formate hydrogenlyase subunit 3/multisubunit Na+/H+ antiporter MnhD subunit
MSFLLNLTIILPLLGAVGMLVVSSLPRVRLYARYIALVMAGLTAILVLALGRVDPVRIDLSLWQPSLLFGATLALRTDVVVQPLALALALATCSVFLVNLGRSEETLPARANVSTKPRPRLMAVLLALLSAGLAALWAANLLTMIISWTVYDLVNAAGRIATGELRQKAVRGLIFGGTATLLLWSGALLSESGVGSEQWTLVTLGNTQLVLWILAGILRLWLYPFHLLAFSDPDATTSYGGAGFYGATPLAAPLLLGPIIGWGLWFRLALANGGSIPLGASVPMELGSGGAWVPSIAAITLALGGFLAWSCKSPRHSLPWIGMGITGSILLAAGLAGEDSAAIIAAGGVAWALGVTVLFLMPFLNAGLQRDAPWWSIPSVLGALALAGAPLTLGFVSEAILMGELTKGGHPEWGVAFFVGRLFLIPSLARWLLSPPSFSLPSQRWRLGVCGVGLGLPALLLIVAGLRPSILIHSVSSFSLGALLTRPGLMGWLLWALPLAGGGVLIWQEENLRPTIELWLSAVYDLLRLEWLYELLAGALERGLGVLRVADEIVGGAGALLWSWVLFLMLLLIWSGR